VNKRIIVLTVLPLTLVAAAVFGYSLTSIAKPSNPGLKQAAKRRQQQLTEACASPSTYQRVKARLFDEAVDIGLSDSARLDLLAGFSVVRMEYPMLKLRDEELGVTVCSGRLILDLPPGVERAFGGRGQLSANVEYASHLAADGSGPVYQLRGAEPIVYRLASFGMRARPQPGDGAVLAAVAPTGLSGLDGELLRAAPGEGPYVSSAVEMPPPAPLTP
jgi:hypothetical protein